MNKIVLGMGLVALSGLGLRASQSEYENKESMDATMRQAGQAVYRVGQKAYEWVNQKSKQVSQEGRQWYAQYKKDALVNKIRSGSLGGRTDLSGEDLARVSLAGANLSGLNFTGADLTGVNFSGANLDNTNFTRAILMGADFSQADLRTANLTKASMIAAALSDRYHSQVFPRRDLSQVVFSETNLRAAVLKHVILKGVNLAGLELTNAYLDDADLSGANLRGAHLEGASLEEANLTNTDLTDAIFSAGTNVQGAIGLTLEQKCYMQRFSVRNIPWARGEGPDSCPE